MGKIKINIPRILITILVIFASIQAYAANCPIKIGGLAPLSAPGSVTGGEAMREAMLLAERDINAKGGVLGCAN